MPQKHMTTTRTYPRGGSLIPPGRVLLLSEEAAEAMEDGQWGRPATEQEIAKAFPAARQASAPVAGAVVGVATEDVRTLIDATDSAKELAEANRLDLLPYAGKGSGKDGRITKADVERWVAPTEAVPPEPAGEPEA